MMPENSHHGQFFSTGQISPLIRQQLSSVLHHLLLQAGHNLYLYCTHSFRIDAATTAASAGFPLRLIKTLGRWNSDTCQSSAGHTNTRVPSILARSVTSNEYPTWTLMNTDDLTCSYHGSSKTLPSPPLFPTFICKDNKCAFVYQAEIIMVVWNFIYAICHISYMHWLMHIIMLSVVNGCAINHGYSVVQSKWLCTCYFVRHWISGLSYSVQWSILLACVCSCL